MTKKHTLPMGPAHTMSKAGKPLFWLDRKRVKEDVYWAEVELLRQQRIAQTATAVEPINWLIKPDEFIEALEAQDRDQQLPPEVEQQKEESEEFDLNGVGDALEELIAEVRNQLTPTITAKEKAALQLAISPLAVHYQDLLDLCLGNTQSANALLGSLVRKGLARYESKEDARFRLTAEHLRYFTSSGPEVQEARRISFTPIGLKLACLAEKAVA